MVGLGTPPQQQSMGGQQAPAPASMEDEPQGGGAQASDREEQALTEFSNQLGEVLYPSDKPGEFSREILANLSGDFDPQILSLFEGAEPPLTASPQDTVAATAVLVTLVVDKQMGLLEQALAAEGQPQPRENEPNEEMPGQPEEDPAGYEGENEDEFSPEAVLMEGGRLAVDALIEIAEAQKIHDFDQEEADGAFYRALDLFRVAQEKVNPRVVASLQKGFEQIKAADQQGQIGKVLPGLPGGSPMQKGV